MTGGLLTYSNKNGISSPKLLSYFNVMRGAKSPTVT